MWRVIALIALTALPFTVATAQTNLLANPGAEEGATEGWVILEGEDDWRQTFPPMEGQYAFGTARTWCRRYQLVDLVEKGYDPAYLDSAPEISVEEHFIGVNNPGQIYMRVILVGDDGSELVDWQLGSPGNPFAVPNVSTGLVWTGTNHVFRQYPASVRKVYWEDGGRAYPGGNIGPFLDAARLVVEDRQMPTVSTAGGASNVTVSSAALGGNLVSTGAAESVVSVYYGLTDGGTNSADWAHETHFPAHDSTNFPAAYTTNVTALASGRLHFYRYAASNSYGVFWSREVGTFLTGQLFVEAIEDTAAEGGPDGRIRVGRPGTATNGPLTVTYTASGTAEQGTDIQPLKGTLTIPTDASYADIPVEVIDDFLRHEPTETVHVSVTPGSYVPGVNSNATVQILENDGEQLSSWQYRCRVTFPGYQSNTPLTNFPALIIFNPAVTGFSYGTFRPPHATDLRFTDDSESYLLPYEIEDWHDAQSNSYVWVRVPLLNSPTNTVWAYWGSPEPTVPPAYTTNGQTWTQGYRGVWHLAPHETSVLADSTAHGRDGYNGGTLVAEGVVSSGRRFRGFPQDFIRLDGTPSSDFLPEANTPINISCWVKSGIVTDGDHENYLVSLSLPAGWPAFGLALGRTNRVYLANARSGSWFAYSSTNALVSSENWTYLTAEYSGNRYFLSANAETIWSTDVLAQDAAGSAFSPAFGSLAGVRDFYQGSLDEIRISDFRPRTEWVWAEMMTMASNSVFTAYGPVERRRRGTVLMVR